VRDEHGIQADGLVREFKGGIRAVDGIRLAVPPGEIYGFLGPNGAGKSTTVHMLTTLLPPTAGTARVAGFDVARDGASVRSAIGAALQEAALDPLLTGREHVRLQTALHGMPRAERRTRTETLLERVGLTQAADRKVRTYSGGMKRRLDLALALAHEPSILFLDEPTAGVDVELRRDMWALVRRLRENGVTIILTTHYIDEAEEMADRIGVMHKGEIILVEDKAELMRKLGKKQLTLHLQKRLDAIPETLARHQLTLAPGGSEIIYTYDTQGERTGITALLQDLSAAGIRFRDLHTTQSSLEDIFVDLVRQRQ
jgi:ABC-2 type transport system ATP-binding protein